MVIFCHLQLFNIGWTGLQSFFVLSGFLITRILLKDAEHATSFGDYLKRFYGVAVELPIHYDLVINTDALSVEQAAALIAQASGA